MRWGASYRLREKRKKGIYTEGHRDTEGTEKRERKNEERFLSARARLLRQREMLLDVLKVGLAVRDRQREGIGCEDVERHALSGYDLMFRNMASLLFDGKEDVARGEAS